MSCTPTALNLEAQGRESCERTLGSWVIEILNPKAGSINMGEISALIGDPDRSNDLRELITNQEE